MRKFSLELPKYRLQLHMKLIKRRKPLVSEPLLPTRSVINKKYRSGTLMGKVVRHFSEHKNTRKVLAANLAAFFVVGTFIPGAQAQTVQNTIVDTTSNSTVIHTQNTLKTEKSLQYPVEKIKINQGYGLFHQGLDLGAEIGVPVKPIKAGIVTEAGYVKVGYGNTVLIDHGNGLTSRYAHLSEVEVDSGEKVTTDTEIGKVGITGRTTGPHLHLEVIQNGVALNPTAVLPR